MAGKNIGGPIGPFNEGQPESDFLTQSVLNQIAKMVAAHKGLDVSAPLSLQRGPHGDVIGLQKRIDNFILCELLEDLVEDTSATAKVLRRDENDDLIGADEDTPSKTLEFEVWDSDIAVGGATIKRYAGQRGIAFQNPFSKNGNWEFLSLAIQQGGTVINKIASALILPGGGSCDESWRTIQFDTVAGSTPGLNFTFLNGEVAVKHDGPLKLAYKVLGFRPGLGFGDSDDAIEVKMERKRIGVWADIEHTFTIGLLDDTHEPCNFPTRNVTYTGTAVCPMFYFNAQADDEFRVRVRRNAGDVAITISQGESFITFEYNR